MKIKRTYSAFLASLERSRSFFGSSSVSRCDLRAELSLLLERLRRWDLWVCFPLFDGFSFLEESLSCCSSCAGDTSRVGAGTGAGHMLMVGLSMTSCFTLAAHMLLRDSTFVLSLLSACTTHSCLIEADGWFGSDGMVVSKVGTTTSNSIASCFAFMASALWMIGVGAALGNSARASCEGADFFGDAVPDFCVCCRLAGSVQSAPDWAISLRITAIFFALESGS